MTSATDELRRLLDERGVAHSDHYLSTTWRDEHGILHLAGEPMADGSLVVDMLTPEQAIAATLGSERHVETCEIESEVWHDHGGYDSDTYEWALSCGHSVEWLDNKPPKHCPECGAKVVKA